MNRQLLLGLKETVYGTPIATPASSAVWAESVKLTPKGDRVRGDPATPGFGPVAAAVYGEHVELSFEVPLTGSGAAGTAAKWAFLAKACGWKETLVATTSATYALEPNPLTADSVTLRWRDALRSHVIAGARGRMGLKLQAGQRPMLTFTFRGLYADPSAGAALAQSDANWTGWADALPIAQGRTTFSLGGVAQALRDLSIDSSDNVQFTDVPHQENIQLLGPRAFSGKVKAGVPGLASFNPEALWKAATVQVAAFVHNVGVAGSIITVNARGQLGEPSYSRDGNEDCYEAAYELVSSGLATDDDIAIVLT